MLSNISLKEEQDGWLLSASVQAYTKGDVKESLKTLGRVKRIKVY